MIRQKVDFVFTRKEKQALRRYGSYLGKKGLDNLIIAVRDNRSEGAAAISPPHVTQTMTNSPGAVQAGRDVTINLRPAPPAPRQLTAEQIGIISQELRTYGVGSVTVWEIGDREANNFAQQFLAAIRASGWQISLNFAEQMIPPPYGLILIVPRKEAPEGVALQKALVRAGLQVEVQVRPDRNQTELLSRTQTRLDVSVLYSRFDEANSLSNVSRNK